ncbi:MAG: hypothetical protein RKO25_00155 [Candidatus Contendobacter sp.]|nr:hypothetical protein [Candidatus Contendobacter sp.]
MTASETRMEQIKKVWEGISKNKVANQKWPYPESNFSLLEALDSWGYKSLSSEINDQYNLLESAIIYSNTPIVMVSGMLNAGKSSVTASFLNQSSKDRIPRGLGRRDGTHRFVLWMPESWEGKIEHMRKFVTSSFSGTEDLPIDPDEAKKAYNATNANTDLLSIPLLAFDSELQDIAILDCPDAQRKHEGPAGTYDPKTIREEFLKKANKLCAVLLFVTDLTRIEDQSTFDLLNKLHDSSLPLLILINSINPEKKFSPENFITDYQNIMAKIKAEYYLAYNFNDKEFDSWFESNQTIYSSRKLDKNNLPVFFRIPVDNPPQILNDRVREFQGNSLSELFVL